MKRQLKLFWIDLHASRLIFLLPIGTTLVLYGLTLFLMKPLSGEMKAWRFGYLGQEFLIVLFLFWTMLILQRWFGQEAEALRSSDQEHSCLAGVLLVLFLELMIFSIGIIVGILFRVYYFWEVVRIMIYQALIDAVVLLLTILFRNIIVPFILSVAYCLLCAVFGGRSTASILLLIHPGIGSANKQTVLALWPCIFVAAILFYIAYKHEKKMIWIS